MKGVIGLAALFTLIMVAMGADPATIVGALIIILLAGALKAQQVI